MLNKEKTFLPKPLNHHCFGCGTANPHGLDLQFYLNNGRVCADIVLGPNHVGWENIVHGGITSTLTDELMSWAIMYFKKNIFFTRKMEIKYIRPVPIHTRLTVTGQIADDSDPAKIKARGEIRDRKNSLLVKSAGEFILVGEDKLFMLPGDFKADMKELFKRFEETGKNKT